VPLIFGRKLHSNAVSGLPYPTSATASGSLSRAIAQGGRETNHSGCPGKRQNRSYPDTAIESSTRRQAGGFGGGLLRKQFLLDLERGEACSRTRRRVHHSIEPTARKFVAPNELGAIRRLIAAPIRPLLRNATPGQVSPIRRPVALRLGFCNPHQLMFGRRNAIEKKNCRWVSGNRRRAVFTGLGGGGSSSLNRLYRPISRDRAHYYHQPANAGRHCRSTPRSR